ncbi:MAG: hypothetical protein AAF387_18625 [Pseudomonadota bacterium]
MSNKLEEKALSLLEKFEDLASEYSPQVIEAAVEAVRVSAIGELLQAFIALLLLVLVAWAFRWGLVQAKAIDCSENRVVARGTSFVFLVLFGGICLIHILSSVGDVWVWTSLVNPELALAHKVLGL